MAGPGHVALPVERGDGEWRPAGAPPPFYMIAVAANVDLPPIVGESSLFDYGLEVIAEHQAKLVRELSRAAGASTSPTRTPCARASSPSWMPSRSF